MEHEKYNRKAVAVSIVMVVIILVAAAALIFSGKSPNRQGQWVDRQVVPGQQSLQAPSQVVTEEETVTVKNKDDAKKALNDLDSLVNSVGDSSL